MPGNRESGFTLVEVLAALAIFSIAAIGLVHATSEGARAATIVERRAMAAIVAENALADTVLDQARLETGRRVESVELSGREWEVERTVSRTPNPLVFELTIQVRAADGGMGDARLTTFRAAQP